MAWYNANWDYRIPITSQNAKVSEAVTNAYVKLDGLGAGFWSHVKNGGGDIRVTETDGVTEVAREIVFCDTGTDKGEIHIDSTGIQTGSDVLWYIYYGNAAASDYAEDATYGREAVWDAGYSLVSHFAEDPAGGSPQLLDSTSNDNDGTANGSMVAGDLVDADVGKGWQFERAKSQFVGLGSPVELVNASDKTYTIILKNILDNPGGVVETYIGNLNMGIIATALPVGTDLGIAVDSGGWKEATFDQTGINNTIFHSLHGVAEDGVSIRFHVDGDLKDTTAVGALSNNTTIFNIGANDSSANWSSSNISEVRVFNGIRSANYITTEHNNLMDVGTFWSIGAEEDNPLETTLNRTGGVLDRTASAVLVRVAIP